MNLKELVPLDTAIHTAEDKIKTNPMHLEYRWALILLCCIKGDWERALKHLQTYHKLSNKEDLVYLLKELIQTEHFRHAVFAGHKKPKFEPDATAPWQHYLLESIANNALDVRAQAYAQMPQVMARLTADNDYAYIIDSDSRLGAHVEVICAGAYQWVALHHIKRLTLHHSKTLMDILWLSVHIELTTGTTIKGWMPTRYVGSEQHAEDMVKLSLTTDWTDINEYCVNAIGQRCWLIDGEAYGILDITVIEFQE